MQRNTAAIELHQVKKQYGKVQALKGIDLTVSRGETVAFLGPNGAGKTTTISLMLGLNTPTSGRVAIFGRSPHRVEARTRIGAMLQESGLPSTLHVQEIIELFRRLYPQSLLLKDALQLGNLSSKAHAAIGTLSGGQRQRLYFVLAMIGDPDVIFLDEPTVGMDIESRQLFWEQMSYQVARGKTVILTTHNLEEVDVLAHRVVVINQGQIIAEGTPQEIKNSVGGGKHIRFTSSSLSKEKLEGLSGVTKVEQHEKLFHLTTEAPDKTFAQLTGLGLSLADVEIVNCGLEEAFLYITRHSHEIAG